MAHDDPSKTTGEHYEVPLDKDGNKKNPLGRGIDNFLRNLLGGEDVGGQPTEMLGILPQAPALGTPASGQQLGIQAGPNTPPTLDETTTPDDPRATRPFVPSGDPFTEADNLPADPITDAVNKAQVTGRPDATWANTYTADDALSGVIGGGFEEGDELSNTGAMITAAGIASPLILLLEGAGLGWLATRLGLGGQKAVGAGKGIADVARTGGGIIAKNPAISAGVGAAGATPIVQQLMQRDKDALNTQVQ